MTDIEVLDPGEPTIAELTAEANAEHRQTGEAISEALAHAIRAGHVLECVRKRLPRGEWGKWMDSSFDGSRAAAATYRRFARNERLLMDKGVTTYRQAFDALNGIATAQLADGREEVAKLLDSGMNMRQAAIQTGMNYHTVYGWFSPKSAAYQKVSRQKRRERDKQSREAKKILATMEAAKQVGGGLATAYSHHRKSVQALQEAHTTSQLMALAYKYEDELGKALRNAA